MNMDLSPKFPRTFAEGEGGGYYNWASADSPVLREAKVAAGKLVLKPRGFALPHYADCSKVGYVLEGMSTLIFRLLAKKLMYELKICLVSLFFHSRIIFYVTITSGSSILF